MAVPHDAQSAALLAHVVTQLQLNVSFLESQNYMSAEDADNMREIVSRLPCGAGQSFVTTSVKVISPPVMTRTFPPPAITPRSIPSPPVQAPAISPVSSQQPRLVKAIWAYNEDGREPNDLSFAAGEHIEVISEKNQDWWLGRAHGREALFPSNHVENIDASSLPQADAVVTTAKKSYKPFGAALHGTDKPPAAGVGVNSVGLQEASGQAEKKSKYGKYGNTMAHSAAGGVGFGAGAAIGGGLVRAIF
ncbi:SH3-domain-containing protein [Suillus clintonianus]|uniref:SH3-domain-containing protein n=1 Tax=Suillus clintonianus TaxID=1904413 RepID=UPI001B85DE08|nr:SH3-domain-containing protein [Suillus clintonianus]KAG2153962.1 SH3-domain-containing protein [Suillus clintonianus]